MIDHISKALEKAKHATPKPAAEAPDPGDSSDVSASASDKGDTKVSPQQQQANQASEVQNQNPKTEKADSQPKKETLKKSAEKIDTAVSGLNGTSITYKETQTVRGNPALLAENRIIAGLKHDPRSAVFQILRTQVLMRLRKEGWHTFAVTSANPGAGKSLIAANMAVSISQEVNQTVLLLDLDLRRPMAASHFGLEPEYGVKDFLLNDVELSKIFLNPGMDRLVLLPGVGTVADSSELLSTPKAVQLVEEIKGRYESRIIIFDLPPLLSTDDALVCIPHVDAVLLVIEDGRTTKEEITRSLQMLEGTELLGTVLNKSETKVESYY